MHEQQIAKVQIASQYNSMMILSSNVFLPTYGIFLCISYFSFCLLLYVACSLTIMNLSTLRIHYMLLNLTRCKVIVNVLTQLKDLNTRRFQKPMDHCCINDYGVTDRYHRWLILGRFRSNGPKLWLQVLTVLWFSTWLQIRTTSYGLYFQWYCVIVKVAVMPQHIVELLIR